MIIEEEGRGKREEGRGKRKGKVTYRL